MMPAVAGFGAGVFAGHALHGCQPSAHCGVKRADSERGSSFKLAVHVHAASAPSLGQQGHVQRLRPRVELSFGGVTKTTEDADFCHNAVGPRKHMVADDVNTVSCGGADDCPWKFGDTLMFAARADDILNAGLQCRLLASSDVCFGPWIQVQIIRADTLGEAVVDTRRRVLPACERAGAHAGGGSKMRSGVEGRASWDSPAIFVPLTRVHSSPRSGIHLKVMGHIVLSFSVNVDPAGLLEELTRLERPLAERVVDPLVKCAQGCSHSETSCASRCVADSEAHGVIQSRGSAEVYPSLAEGVRDLEEPESEAALGNQEPQADVAESGLPPLGSMWPLPRTGRVTLRSARQTSHRSPREQGTCNSVGLGC